jgi:hypothetical protein
MKAAMLRAIDPAVARFCLDRIRANEYPNVRRS